MKCVVDVQKNVHTKMADFPIDQLYRTMYPEYCLYSTRNNDARLMKPEMKGRCITGKLFPE